MNGKIKGIVTENEVMTELTRHGIDVSIPRGDNAPYDLVADINGRLYKIQVKWPRFRYYGSFALNCTRDIRTKDGAHIHEQYADTDVDYFATCANGKCYMVSPWACRGCRRQCPRSPPRPRRPAASASGPRSRCSRRSSRRTGGRPA